MKKYFLSILFIGFWGCDEVDSTNPQVSITSPNFEGLESNIVFGVITIVSDVYDEKGINRVEFLIDESIICTDNEAPYECEWDTRDYELNSEYVISIKAYDDSGNIGQDVLTVIVDHYVELWGESYSAINTEELIINANSLSGEIPSSIGVLVNLKSLEVHSNQLSGQIPAEIGNLTKLISLNLMSNQITGQIPAEIGNLINLERLILSGNQLSGQIPAEFGNLTNLKHLQFSGNNLIGTFPPEIGNLINLTYFNANSNNLSGTLPTELGNLTALNGFYIAWNNFSGIIPEEICGITGYIEIGGNAFCNPIPDCIQGVGQQDTSNCN
tara:strand:- start:47 stop:1027 length:981 start_codon:yes stop_codon:yes gene_type:complete